MDPAKILQIITNSTWMGELTLCQPYLLCLTRRKVHYILRPHAYSYGLYLLDVVICDEIQGKLRKAVLFLSCGFRISIRRKGL